MTRPADRDRQLRTLRLYVAMPQQSAKELAGRLGMTTRQVYRDLEALRAENGCSTLGLAYWLGVLDTMYQQQSMPWAA